MAGDFNIKNSSWDFSFLHHSIHCNLLNNIADSMYLCMSKTTNYVPTRYLDNQNNLNSVIGLIFLCPNSSELNNHIIYPEQRLLSDCVPLTVNIAIIKEHIQTKKCTIIKNSKEKRNFITELIEIIKPLNMEQILSKEILEQTVQQFTDDTERTWFKHSRNINITRYSKLQWNKECQKELENYSASSNVKNWRKFRNITKKTKCAFFNVKIQETMAKRGGPWELINQVKKHKLPAIEVIQHNG